MSSPAPSGLSASLLVRARFFLLFLALLLDASQVALELFLHFEGIGELALLLSFADLFFKEEFAFCGFRLVGGVYFGEGGLGLFRELAGGNLFFEAFHGQFVGGFHKLGVECSIGSDQEVALRLILIRSRSTLNPLK